MCLICVTLNNGSLTLNEARRNLGEMRSTISEEHITEVEALIEEKQQEELSDLALQKARVAVSIGLCKYSDQEAVESYALSIMDSSLSELETMLASAEAEKNNASISYSALSGDECWSYSLSALAEETNPIVSGMDLSLCESQSVQSVWLLADGKYYLQQIKFV